MAYLVVNCRVEITGQSGKYIVNRINTIEIVRSIETLTDTATVTIPRRLIAENIDLRTLVKKGDRVQIFTGYGQDVTERFDGYVTKIGIETPMTIHCQDSAFALKNDTIKKSYDSVKVSELIADILPAYISVDVTADYNLGAFKINDATATEVLEVLRSKYKLRCFFRSDGVLNVGLAYPLDILKTTIFDLQRNVKSSALEYVTAEDQKIKIKGVSVQADNTKIEYSEGDESGSTRTYYYNELDLNGLKAAVKNEITKDRATKYGGSFTAFGTPSVNVAEIVEIRDRQNGIVGEYRIKAVTERWSVDNGGEQIITPDIKVG